MEHVEGSTLSGCSDQEMGNLWSGAPCHRESVY